MTPINSSTDERIVPPAYHIPPADVWIATLYDSPTLRDRFFRRCLRRYDPILGPRIPVGRRLWVALGYGRPQESREWEEERCKRAHVERTASSSESRPNRHRSPISVLTCPRGIYCYAPWQNVRTAASVFAEQKVVSYLLQRVLIYIPTSRSSHRPAETSEVQ